MSIIRKISHLLSWRRKQLRPYELETLITIQATLSPRARSIIDSQLTHFAFVQRHVSDKEVNFYFRVAAGEAVSPLLPSPFPEWPIGIAYFSTSNDAFPTRATVWVANGQLFSIVFSRSPTEGVLSVLEKQMLLDPIHEEDKLTPTSQNVDYLIQRIRPLLPNVQISAIQPPLDADLRRRLLIPTADCVPHDFCTLLSNANGCRVENWQINGLPLREVAMEGSNLFVLAEAEGQLLCAKDGDRARSVYLWNIDNENEISMGTAFANAFKICVSAQG
jgi:hypothetical protein